MPSPNDPHAALVRRFGETAVSEKLAAMGVRRISTADGSMVFQSSERKYGTRGILPDPCAMAVLESVGEGLLWGERTRIHRVARGFVVHIDVSGNTYTDCVTVFDSKAAALVAACESKDGR